MKSIKGMTPIRSSAGYTAVNPKYAFSNSRVLSGVAESTKVLLPEIRNAIKIVNPEVDKQRTVSPVALTPSSPSRVTIPPTTLTPITTLAPTVITPVRDFAPGVVTTGSVSVPPPRSMSLPGTERPVPFSSIAISDRRIFGSGSFLNAFGSNIGEKTSGQKIQDDSKCRVVAILAENITEGYPRSNLLIIKKSDSETVQPQTYAILKKNLFRDSDYSKLVEVNANDVSFKQEYAYILEDLGLTERQVFTIRDSFIEKNTSYIYKVQLSWIPKLNIGPAEPPSVSLTATNILGTIRIR